MSATAKQRGYIHALAGKAGMDEDTRRDFLERETGRRSTTQISVEDAKRVIDKLKALAGGGAVAMMDSPVAKKLRALWIAAHDLGLLRDRSDRALLSFLERQTGVSHPNFLREPGAGAAAIEALKSWLARAGGVEWPGRHAGLSDTRRAVLCAQWQKLIALGAVDELQSQDIMTALDCYAFKVAWKSAWIDFRREDFDAVQNALGRKLRRALAQAEAAP